MIVKMIADTAGINTPNKRTIVLVDWGMLKTIPKCENTRGIQIIQERRNVRVKKYIGETTFLTEGLLGFILFSFQLVSNSLRQYFGAFFDSEQQTAFHHKETRVEDRPETACHLGAGTQDQA